MRAAAANHKAWIPQCARVWIEVPSGHTSTTTNPEAKTQDTSRPGTGYMSYGQSGQGLHALSHEIECLQCMFVVLCVKAVS